MGVDVDEAGQDDRIRILVDLGIRGTRDGGIRPEGRDAPVSADQDGATGNRRMGDGPQQTGGEPDRVQGSRPALMPRPKGMWMGQNSPG